MGGSLSPKTKMKIKTSKIKKEARWKTIYTSVSTNASHSLDKISEGRIKINRICIWDIK